MKKYRAGIDIGSTTVKIVLLDEKTTIISRDGCRNVCWKKGKGESG